MHVIIKRIFKYHIAVFIDSNFKSFAYIRLAWPISYEDKNFCGAAMPRYENTLIKPKCHFILLYIFFAKNLIFWAFAQQRNNVLHKTIRHNKSSKALPKLAKVFCGLMRVKRCKNDKIALAVVCHCALASIIPLEHFKKLMKRGEFAYILYCLELIIKT